MLLKDHMSSAGNEILFYNQLSLLATLKRNKYG